MHHSRKLLQAGALKTQCAGSDARDTQPGSSGPWEPEPVMEANTHFQNTLADI